MRLAASRNFIIYDENEGIVRYAMTSTIEPLEGEADPCSSVDCGPEGLCLVVGTAHKCKCRPGYTGVGQVIRLFPKNPQYKLLFRVWTFSVWT